MASFTSSLRAVLDLDTSPFKRGLASVDKGVKSLKQTLAESEGSSLFGRFLGIGAVLVAFSATIKRAQDLRDEAAKIGAPISDATRSVAELGDTFSRAKDGAADFGVSTLGFLGRIGEKIGEVDAKIFGLFQGRSFADTQRIIDISEQAAANAQRIERETAEARDKNAERLQADEEYRRKQLSDFNLLNQIEKDREAIQKRIREGATPLEREEARLDLVKKQTEIDDQRAKINKAADDDRARAASRAKQIADAQAALRKKSLTDEEQIKALQSEIVGLQNELNGASLTTAEHDAKRIELLKKQGEVLDLNAKMEAAASAARAKAYDADQAAEEELARLQQERAERFLTGEQKIWAIVQAGRRAQAELANNPGDVNALLRVERLRKAYLDLTAQLKAASDAKSSFSSSGDGTARGETGYRIDPRTGRRTGEYQVGEDGKTRLRGVIISEEDRARSRATLAKNAAENERIARRRISTSDNPATKAAISTAEEIKRLREGFDGLISKLK